MSFAILVQFAATLVSLILLLVGIAKRNIPKSLYFTYIALALLLYTGGFLLEMLSSSYEAALLACRIQYMGLPFLGPLYYLFTRSYFDRPVRNKKVIAALLGYPLIFVALMNTYPLQTLFYSRLDFTKQPFPHLIIFPGPFYYLSVMLMYLFLVLGAVVTLRAYLETEKEMRKHMNLFPIATLLPAIAGTLYFVGLLPSGVDYTSATLAFTMMVFSIYTLRYRAPDWMPLARDSVLENIHDAFILLDTNNYFLDANAIAYEYFPQLKYVSAKTPASKIPDFPLQLMPGYSSDPTEFTVERNGETRWLRASSTPIQANGKTVCTSILIYDVTEMHQMMQELHELATHDALTGLYNRGTFYKFAARDFELAVRNDDAASILMLDIDFFKLVNDRYGHQTGDDVLVAIAEILVGRLRRTDIIGRYGGEEILVFLPGASYEGAMMIADVIRRTVEQRVFYHNKKPFQVTVSIGTATLDPEVHESIEDLVLAADSAMYKAKTSGRNKVMASEPVPAGKDSD